MSKLGNHSRLTRAFLAGGVGAAVVGAGALVGLAMGRDRTPPPEAAAPAPGPTQTAVADPTPSPTLTLVPTAAPASPAPTSTAPAGPQSGGPRYALRGLDGQAITSASQRGKVTVLFFIVPG